MSEKENGMILNGPLVEDELGVTFYVKSFRKLSNAEVVRHYEVWRDTFRIPKISYRGQTLTVTFTG